MSERDDECVCGHPRKMHGICSGCLTTVCMVCGCSEFKLKSSINSDDDNK